MKPDAEPPEGAPGAARPPAPDAPPGSKRRRIWLWAGLSGLVVALAIVLGAAWAGWHYSDRVLVPDHSGWPADIEVLSVSPRQIELERTEDTERPGLYGLEWRGGHAIVGEVLDAGDDTVTRRLLEADGYLVAGREVALSTSVFTGNPREARGLPFQTVPVEGELGEMPAWLVPARGNAWAIFVHGINDDPEASLRLSPLIRRIGMPSLAITYREDLGAPESPDGYHHMGLTEWRDLEAAARYAIDRGAAELYLVGYSMGGAIITQFMQHSALASRVDALVLDAPALDWERIIEFNATEMGMPGFSSLPVRWAIGARIDADWESLDALRHTDDLELPILLFHGEEDDVVPIETSDELAEALPRWVTYYRVPRAGHTQAWNVEPRKYESRTEAFLDAALK